MEFLIHLKWVKVNKKNTIGKIRKKKDNAHDHWCGSTEV